MLCEKCLQIHFKPASDYGLADESYEGYQGIIIVPVYYFHHVNKATLQQSAHEGCHFCTMIWSVLFGSASVRAEKQWTSPWLAAGDRVYFKSTFRYLPPNHNMLKQENQEPVMRFEYVTVGCEDRTDTCRHSRTSKDPFSHMLAELTLGSNKASSYLAIDAIPSIRTNHAMCSPELDNSTTSEANILLARTWLNTCINGHQPCGLRVPEPASPRRVINISNPTWPWLQESNAIKAQYVALSYKWGSCEKYITTTQNYHQHKKAIPIHRLPKTFKEAIQVAHDLGFLYLWIDAICIIQDSQEDLSSQIASMDQVYQNATLTIFAAGGDDVTSGLSTKRDPRVTKPCRLPIKLTVHEEAFQDFFYIILYSTSNPGYNLYPIFSRGWVLQEQVLSRRSLIFGDDLMSWSCVCSNSSENFPILATTFSATREIAELSPDIYKHPDLVPGFKVLALWLADQNPLPDRLRSRRNNHFDEWYKMVSTYSMYALTNPFDALPAVQGVANAMARMHSSTYHKGLWVEDLQVGLAWRVVKASKYNSPAKSSDNSKEECTNIPSWSWASRWGYHIEFLDWEANEELYSWEGVGFVEEESSGNGLVVFGRVREAKVRPMLRRKKYRYHQWKGSVFDLDSEGAIGEIAYDVDPLTTELSLVTCLLCTVQKKNDFKLICLALVPTGNMPNEYQRVGLIFLNDQKWFGYIDRGCYGPNSTGFKDFQRYARKLKIV